MPAAHAQTAMDLSIVIPTRDRRERLLATLDALDRQRLDGVQVEVVVVDNGSTDGTEAACARVGKLPGCRARRAARGRVVRPQPRAQARARAGRAAARRRHGAREGEGLLAGHVARTASIPSPATASSARSAGPSPSTRSCAGSRRPASSSRSTTSRRARSTPRPTCTPRTRRSSTQALRDAGGFDARAVPVPDGGHRAGHPPAPPRPAAGLPAASCSCATTIRQTLERLRAAHGGDRGGRAPPARAVSRRGARPQITAPGAKGPLYAPAAVAGPRPARSGRSRAAARTRLGSDPDGLLHARVGPRPENRRIDRERVGILPLRDGRRDRYHQRSRAPGGLSGGRAR